MPTCRLTHYAACQIDVEGCELDVLRGVHDEHWPRIQQVELDLQSVSPKARNDLRCVCCYVWWHDVGSRLNDIQSLLQARGFKVTVVQDDFSKAVGLNNHHVYAQREPEKPGTGLTSHCADGEHNN